MPFFDDSGIVREDHRGPVIGAFAAFIDQVERMVAVSIGWVLPLFPAMLALAFPVMPGWLRLALVVGSSLALIPATGALYVLAARALDGEQLSLQMARDTLQDTVGVSIRALTPLFALLCLLAWMVMIASAWGVLIAEVASRVAVLLVLVAATYWGPLHVAHPDAWAVTLLRRSAGLAWRYPATTMKTCLTVAVLAVFGAITVAGAVLAAPVLIALLHLNLYENVGEERSVNRGES